MIDIAAPIEADALRIRHEFLAAPGIRLSAATTARLFGVSLGHASELLEDLALEGFLLRTAEGVYRRTGPSQVSRFTSQV